MGSLKELEKNPELKEEYGDIFDSYMEIIDEALKTAIDRIGKTGRGAYEKNELERDLKLIFSRLERKFRRAEHITWNFNKILDLEGCSKKELLEYLKDAYFDAINYNVMAVQMIEKYLKEE